MSNIGNPLFRILLLQRNGTVLDMRQKTLNFPSFSMQLKDAKKSYPNSTETLVNTHDIKLQPGKQSVIWIKTQIYKEHEVTEIL